VQGVFVEGRGEVKKGETSEGCGRAVRKKASKSLARYKPERKTGCIDVFVRVRLRGR